MASYAYTMKPAGSQHVYRRASSIEHEGGFITQVKPPFTREQTATILSNFPGIKKVPLDNSSAFEIPSEVIAQHPEWVQQYSERDVVTGCNVGQAILDLIDKN